MPSKSIMIYLYVLVITPPRVIWCIYSSHVSKRGCYEVYSLAPSKRIDMGKTWPVYTVWLRALGHRRYSYGLNIVRATSKGPLGARL